MFGKGLPGSITPLYTVAEASNSARGLCTRYGGNVHRRTVRTVLTILMYAGVGVFLLPYVFGKASTAPLLMLLGATIAVVCGLLRCYLTENE
jgi:hypothetical protein